MCLGRCNMSVVENQDLPKPSVLSSHHMPHHLLIDTTRRASPLQGRSPTKQEGEENEEYLNAQPSEQPNSLLRKDPDQKIHS